MRFVLVLMLRVVHGIVCSRIILNLRQASSSEEDAHPVLSTGIMFEAPPLQRTNQTETLLLEIRSIRNNNEDPREQIDEDFVVEQGIAL